MKNKNYQRKHLRAPFKESVLYADGAYVLKARALNISEGGMLLDHLPSFPEKEEIPLLISLPQLPILKNFSLLKLQTFSPELFGRNVIWAKARLVRRDHLSKDLDNLFRSNLGLEFIHIEPQAQKHLEEYVLTFTSNIIHLQTLIDAFNCDEETKMRTRVLAQILGYQDVERIAHLRACVTNDYKSLQWI